MSQQVWVCKRKTGCRKVCPHCGAKNSATAVDCRKCRADLRKVKRTYAGKGLAYSIRWIDPRTGRLKSETTGPDKAYAQFRASERRRELLSGEYMGVKAISFDDFVLEHLGKLENTLSEGSYVEHERTLEQFNAACEPKDLTSIDFQMLEKFREARLRDKVSLATVNKCLRTLQAALQRAVQRGYLKENPFKGNRQALFVLEPEPVPVVLEPHEFRKLAEACMDERWRGICTVGYFAGLRQGEILALEWQDVDFENRILHVRNKQTHRTKSRKNRDVPMSKEIAAVLEALHYMRTSDSHVFTNLGNRKMQNNICRDFEAILKRAGLVDAQGRARFSMHDLRRSFITNLLASGTDPKSVQVLAGHANVQTTLKHYAAVRKKNLAVSIDRMSELVSHCQSTHE